MRIPSASEDRYVFFVAEDTNGDRVTGLSSGFTVYACVDDGAAGELLSPTIGEIDATNMPGVYRLELGDATLTTIDPGHDTEELVLHVTHASMKPVTRVVELYRPKVTEGQTVSAASGKITTVATCESNSDMRGTDDAALASVCTAGRLAELDAGNIPADVDTLLTRCAESRMSQLDIALATAASLQVVDGVVDAIAAIVAANLDDAVSSRQPSGSVQVSGIDANAVNASALATDAVTEIKDAIVAALNNLDSAGVQAACDTALRALRLHELVLEAMGSAPVASSLFSDLVEDDAGTYRFTANALEQAPAAAGGLSQQSVRDAMKLAPSAGAPVAGSVDAHLDTIEAGGGGGGGSVVVGPLVAVRDPANRTTSPVTLEMHEGDNRQFLLTVLDSAGESVDLSAITLRFVVNDAQEPATGLFKVESIPTSGDDNEVALVTVAAAQSAAAGVGSMRGNCSM